MKKFILWIVSILIPIILFSNFSIANAKRLQYGVRPENEMNFNKKEKKVFLTFDDGPSISNTLKILNILKEDEVKATFFVIGKKIQQNPAIIEEEINGGMSIQPHSYTHNYSIYKNENKYFDDFDKCVQSINTVDKNFSLKYIRLIGGSDNHVCSNSILHSIKREINNRGIYYVDWNVSSADAAPKGASMERIYENVTSQCSNKDFCVVLMHDSEEKNTTVEALPSIIKYLKKKGFVFRTFEDVTGEELNKMIKLKIINR